MGEVPAEFCGYEWPKDCERFEYDNKFFLGKDNLHQQTTCVREALPDTDRCAWHTAPDETKHKSIEALRGARMPAEIRGESKAGESLDGAILAGMELEDELGFRRALLRYANLSEVNLEGADLLMSNLQSAGLSEADLSETNLQCADFSDADLLSADLSEASLRLADFSSANLSGANLQYADLFSSDLSEASLSDANLSDADLSEVDLSDADIDDANFSDALLYRTDLSGLDLSEANLSEADLSEADLSEADHDDASFSGANLTGANLSGLNLSEANLIGANLSGTNLTDANLRAASLSNADLAGATIADLEINSATSVDGFAEQSSAEEWIKLARAYHDLKLECHDAGFVGKARQLHISERRARRRETAAEVGWFSRQHLPQFVSGLFTGYGVGVWRLVGTMTALFAISTVTYALAGGADPLTYSTITFATSPPRPTGSLPIWARFVANVETFVGTLLIVSLGFVLGNREQF